MISSYFIACQHGFPFLRGEGVVIDRKAYSRYTKKNSGKGPSLYVHVSMIETHVLKGEMVENEGTDHRGRK